MKRSAILLSLLFLAVAGFSQNTFHVDYEPSDAIIANPERGLDRQIYMSGSGNQMVSAATLRKNRQEKCVTFYRLLVTLDQFMESNISDDFLNNLRTNLATLRSEGAKCSIRFKYSDDYSASVFDTTPEWVQRHIGQIKPVLEEYADVITIMEAGFIGPTGEWALAGDNAKSKFWPDTDFSLRTALIQSLLDATPASRFVSVRVPNYKVNYLQTSYTDTITRATAYDGSAKSRLGAYNDGFLWNADDGGTFGGSKERRTYWQRESLYTPMGGEAPERSQAGGGHEAGYFTSRDTALSAMRAYHYSYLEYSSQSIGQGAGWDTNGMAEEIARKLGYRFTLTSGDYAVSGRNLFVSFGVRNDGWAAPYLPHDLSIKLLKGGTVKYTLPLEGFDVRFWLPETTSTVEATLTLPDDFADGDYDLCLAITDPEPTLRDNPLYNIRLANEATWLEQHGMNHLCYLRAESGTLTFVGSANITWVVKDGGNVLAKLSQLVMDGALLPAPPSELNRPPYFSVSAPAGIKAADGMEVELTVETTFTFGTDGLLFSATPGQLFATSRDDVRWYTLLNKNGGGTYYLTVTSPTTIATHGTVSGSADHWAFVGNPYDGFYVCNQSNFVSGYDYVLSAASGQQPRPVMAAVGDESYPQQLWQLCTAAPNGEQTCGGFILRPFFAQANALRFDYALYVEEGSDEYWGDVIAYPTVAAVQENDYTALFNAEVKPWFIPAHAGEMFYMKRDVLEQTMAAYDFETLSASCPFSAYAVLRQLVDNKETNFTMPQTGYYRLSGKEENTNVIHYLTRQNGRFANDPVESTLPNFLGSVIHVVNNGDGTYYISAQGKYLNYNGDNYVYGQDTPNPVRLKLDVSQSDYQGRAAIWLDGKNEAGNLSETHYLLTKGAGWKADRPDSWWTFESADGDLLNVPLTAIGSNAYATLAVPFPWEMETADVVAYSLELGREKDSGVYQALLHSIDGVVPAGLAVVLMADDTPASAAIRVNTADAPCEVAGNALTGTYLPLDWAGTDHAASDMTLGRKDGVPGFYRWTGTQLGANKAYIEGSRLGGNVRAVVLEPTATGTGRAVDTPPSAAATYDLQGRRVAAPAAGVYVRNGRKVLVR